MSETLHTQLRNYFRTQPIEKAWLFGSFARGDQREDSDVDIMVRFTPNARISLFKYSAIMCGLEDLLMRPVDLVEEGHLKAFAIPSVERDKILIYERTD